MSRGAILHLFNWDKKFTPPFRDLIHEHFEGGQHKFIVYGNVDPGALPPSDDTVVYHSLLKNAPAVMKAIARSEKVILHGLFGRHVLFMLALQPRQLKKCCWVLWGGDLYVHQAVSHGLGWKTDELFRRFIFKRLAQITTTVPGDYLLAQKWYKTRAAYIQNLMYPSHLYRKNASSNGERNVNLVIQIGNSADPSNNHKEIIDKLVQTRRDDFVAYAPLSYGNSSYRDEIVSYGRQKLGDRFNPIVEFMSSGEYDSYLQQIDIAIFNHRRQQAMGNIIALLSLGKTIYMRSDITPWEYLTGLGLEIRDSSRSLSIQTISLDDSDKNRAICIQQFSKAALISAWGKVFDGGS